MLYVLSETRVVNSRFFKRQNVVWRRRKTSDGVVFTTRESIDLEQLLTITKKTGEERDYKPAKLFLSVLKSCDHMKDSGDVAWQIHATVEEKITAQLDETLTISSKDIARLVLETLKQFNTTAYVKYASHHPALVSSRKLAATIH